MDPIWRRGEGGLGGYPKLAETKGWGGEGLEWGGGGRGGGGSQEVQKCGKSGGAGWRVGG